MRRQETGFTLIELLITLTILSLVMFSGTYAYQFMSDNWQRNKSAYQEQLTAFQSWRIVTTALNNTAPKLVADENRSGFYFLGRDNGFTAYTSVSVQAPEYPAVYRLFIEPAEGATGTWQLVYEEAPLNRELLTTPEQQLPFNYRNVLLDNIAAVQLEYFGWANAAERLQASSEFSDELLSPRWFEAYDGFERNQHPTVIRLRIDGFEWDIQVPDRGVELSSQMAPDDV